MKKALICLLFLPFLSMGQTSTGEDYHREYPKYEAVLTYLMDYMKSSCEECRPVLSKRPEGYFLEIFSQATNEQLASLLVWDSKTKQFLPVDVSAYYPDYVEDNYDDLHSLLDNKSRFDFMLFYGYPQWTADTKKVLEREDKHSLWELEILARTYSEEARAYIHPSQLGYNFEFTQGFSKDEYGKIPAFRLEKFVELADKSLEFWYQIEKADSSYHPFLITNLQEKIGHDVMDDYLMMLSVKEDALAQKYLQKVRYPEWLLRISERYLTECAQNAFLFSNGDSDTYPLWYLQETRNVRKDVRVMNLSLIQTGWYNQMNCDRMQLKSSFTYDQLFRLEHAFAVYEEGGAPDIEALSQALIRELNENKESQIILPITKPYTIELFGVKEEIRPIREYQSIAELFVYDLLKNYPAGKFYFTHNYGIWDLGLNYVQRGFTFEVSKVKPDLSLIDGNLAALLHTISQPQSLKMGPHAINVFNRVEAYRKLIEKNPDLLLKSNSLKIIKTEYNPLTYLKAGDFENFSVIFQLQKNKTPYVTLKPLIEKWMLEVPLAYDTYDETIHEVDVFYHFMFDNYFNEISNSKSEQRKSILKLEQRVDAESAKGVFDAYYWTGMKLSSRFLSMW